MSATPNPNDNSWSTIVSKSLRSKVPPPLSRYDIAGNRESYKVDIMFEDPEISEYFRHQRALSIVKTAIQPGAVIFSLPRRLFAHQSEAYKCVIDQLGPVVGNYFNPLSLRGSRSCTDLVFYTKFREEATTQRALTDGILVDSIQYKAIPYKDKTDTNNHVRVNLTIDFVDEEEAFLANLQNSLSNYGRVLQIKRLLNHGFFEGEVSVLLDRGSDASLYQELQRMLYLEAWDAFAPASFKGAKPICFYCREAGHVKKECPSLQKIVCFRCGGSGHTQRRCKANLEELLVPEKRTTSFEEDLAAYTASETTGSAKDLPSGPALQAPREENPVNQGNNNDTENALMRATDNTVLALSSDDKKEVPLDPNSATPTGAFYSKFAPIDLRTTMDVDSSVQASQLCGGTPLNKHSNAGTMKDDSSNSDGTDARKGHE